jgi:MFS family permease
MTILFFEPFGRAWNRMKAALFRPFDLRKWFVVGFSAFLAGLTRAHNGTGGSGYKEHVSFREFLDLPARGWEWLMSHPGWAVAIAFLTLVVLAIVVVLTWLSSKGTFMFIDNVVRDKAEIAKPWREYSKEANSLFVWRLVFGFICLLLFVALAVSFFTTAAALYDQSFGRIVPLGFIIGMSFLALIFILVSGYITLFLSDFVAPLMYRKRISAVQAWGAFLGLFKSHPFHFLGYGIIIFLLVLAFVAAVIVAVIGTCCLAGLFLVIPYIGTVVTLPVWYTFRAFSLEFLAQFGPEYNLFPPAEPVPAPAGAAQPPAADRDQAG